MGGYHHTKLSGGFVIRSECQSVVGVSGVDGMGAGTGGIGGGVTPPRQNNEGVLITKTPLKCR